jgi:hypothetical protein
MPGDTLDVRMAHLEGAYEQIDRRLTGFEQRVEARFQSLENTIAVNRSHGDKQFFWTIGLIVVSIIFPYVTRIVAHP